MSIKRHRITKLKVTSSPHVKSDKIEVTYEDMSKKTMTPAEFKQMHKDVES